MNVRDIYEDGYIIKYVLKDVENKSILHKYYHHELQIFWEKVICTIPLWIETKLHFQLEKCKKRRFLAHKKYLL